MLSLSLLVLLVIFAILHLFERAYALTLALRGMNATLVDWVVRILCQGETEKRKIEISRRKQHRNEGRSKELRGISTAFFFLTFSFCRFRYLYTIVLMSHTFLTLEGSEQMFG